MKTIIGRLRNIIYPFKVYGYYFCDDCYNFHYGWYKKHYTKDSWYRISGTDKQLCKANKRINKETIDHYCLPKFKPAYDGHYYRNGKCLRCDYKIPILTKKTQETLRELIRD